MPTHVLLIDDDDDIRAALRLLLEDEGGYVITDTPDTEQAIMLLHTSPQRLVVLFDYRMPRRDSAALLALAERESQLADRHAFVCMTTTNNDRLPVTLKALLARYHVPYIAKPFDIDTLLAVIRQAEQRLKRPRAHLPRGGRKAPPRRKSTPD